MRPDEDEATVVFRKWPGGGILALFPEIPADLQGATCQSYEHIGQHGGADYQHCISRTTPARPGEYADLKEELEKIGYKLKVVSRATPQMTRARQETARRQGAIKADMESTSLEELEAAAAILDREKGV